MKNLDEKQISLLRDIPTSELMKELAKREAVQAIWIDPYESFEIMQSGHKIDTDIDKGACWVYIIWD